MKQLLIYLSVVLLLAMFGNVAQAQSSSDWPHGYRNCLQKKKSYRQNCTSTRRLFVYNADYSTTSALRKNFGDEFSDKQRRKQLKRAGLEHLFDRTRQGTNFVGLRSENDRVLLPTSYKAVFPISDKMSVVKTFDDKWYFAKHGSFELSSLPKDWNRFGSYSNGSLLPETLIFTRNQQSNGLRTLTVLTPDGQWGASIDNVDGGLKVSQSNKKLGAQVKNGFLLANTINLSTGGSRAIAMDYRGRWRKEVPTVKFFQETAYGRKIKKSRWTRGLIEIGSPPEFLGYNAETMYWFLNEQGEMAEKPENVYGLIPMTFNQDRQSPRLQSYVIIVKHDNGLRYLIMQRYPGKKSEILVDKIKEKLNSGPYLSGLFFTENAMAVRSEKAPDPASWYARYYALAAGGIFTYGSELPNSSRSFSDAISDFDLVKSGLFESYHEASVGRSYVEALEKLPIDLERQKKQLSLAYKRNYKAEKERAAIRKEQLEKQRREYARRLEEEKKHYSLQQGLQDWSDAIRNSPRILECRKVSETVERCYWR